MTDFQKMIDEQLENMTDEEFDQMRANFLKSEFAPQDTRGLLAYGDIGLKVLQEDSSLNLYELYQSDELRAKTWEMVALTACHLSELEPKEKWVNNFKELLEEYFQNIVRKEVRKANPVAVSKLVKIARQGREQPFSREELERLSTEAALLLVALEEAEDENMGA